MTIRRELRSGDAEAIVELHDRIYRAEYGMNDAFVDGVGGGIERAVAAGWPEAGGGLWIAERGGRVAGCVALTDEGEGVGKLRWVVLAPEVRGLGLGRRLVGEAVATAREQGMVKLWLDSFERLLAADRIYRSLGFEVVSVTPREDLGPPILLQQYELEL